MSTVIATSLLPDSTANNTLTIGGTGDSIVMPGNLLTMNSLQDAGGNSVFVSDGAGAITSTGLPGDMKFLSSQTASNQASLAFTSGIDSTYDVYCWRYFQINPVTDDTNFVVQFSADGGSTVGLSKTTTFFYAYNRETAGSQGVSYQTSRDLANSTSSQQICSLIGNDTDACGVGEFWLFDPLSTTYVKHFYGTAQGYESISSGPYSLNAFVSGYVNDTRAVNGVQFSMSSGNFDGHVAMYGLKKS